MKSSRSILRRLLRNIAAIYMGDAAGEADSFPYKPRAKLNSR